MTAHRRGSGLRSLSLLVGQSSRRCGTQAARVDRTAPNATMEGAGALVASVGRVAASGSATRRASGSSACASGRPWRPATALVGAPRSGARRADVRGSFAVSAVATGGGERRARGDGAGPARRSRASLANGDGARASSRGSSPRDTSPAGEDRRAPRRGAGAPGASRASAPGSASGDDADAAPRSRASSRDAGSARVALARDGRAASPDTPARRDANPPESAPRRRARDLARGSRDENEGRAAAATARLRSGAMKSPVATAALSSVRVAREARAPSAASRSAKTSRTRASAAATANATAAASANASAAASASGGSRRPSPPFSPSPSSFAQLRREASSILRALDAARAAPGGLRETLGSDPTTVHRLVDALCAAGMLSQACAFAREMLEAGVRAPPEAIATLVRHGARAGMPDGVRDAFEEYVRAGGRPTLRAYTDVVSGLTKAEARMKRTRSGTTSDRSAGGGTRSDAASDAAASDTAAISTWKSLVAASREDASLTPDGAAYTAAVAAYLSAGRAREADRLVREMTRANVSAGPRLYNVLIAARGRAGDARGVRAAEAQMRASGVRPNAATHGARVYAYARCGELDLAEKALRAGMRAKEPASRPTVRAYTAMVQALARAGRADEANGWVREMREAGCAPNAHTYTAIVDGFARAGNPVGAEATVDAMRADGVAPTAVTFNALLKAYTRREESGKEGHVDDDGDVHVDGDVDSPSPNSPNLEDVRRVLESMRAAGVDATVVTYNTLIDACAEAGEPTEAMFRVLSALVAAGHRPDVVTYTTLLKHFSREGDVVAARWLMREMESDAAATPDAPAFNALVDALCRAGLTEEATTTLARMRAGGCAPDVGTYGALMDGFTRARDWASAASLYAALERRGEDPDGRGWRLGGEGADRETQSSGTFDAVEPSAPEPDARMRAALAAACGRAGGAAAGAAAEAERLIASVAARPGAGAAAEAAKLRQRWRRELAGAGATRGRTTVLDKKKIQKRRQSQSQMQSASAGNAAETPEGMDAVAVAAAAASVAGGGGVARSDADSRADDASDATGADRPVAGPAPAASPGGLEMWKHWLGLPSQYYAGESGAAPPTVAESAESARAEAEATGSNPAVVDERKYTKEEISEAVRVLRAAAARRFPDDPETALRLALEAAEEGDARRLRE